MQRLLIQALSEITAIQESITQEQKFRIAIQAVRMAIPSSLIDKKEFSYVAYIFLAKYNLASTWSVAYQHYNNHHQIILPIARSMNCGGVIANTQQQIFPHWAELPLLSAQQALAASS